MEGGGSSQNPRLRQQGRPGKGRRARDLPTSDLWQELGKRRLRRRLAAAASGDGHWSFCSSEGSGHSVLLVS
jgi:hypothetical protein